MNFSNASDAALIQEVARELQSRGFYLTTAESCTGGLLSNACVAQSGSSTWYSGGWIVYANKMKQSELGVPCDILEKYGAVSVESAHAMCVGAIARSGAQVAISTTGIAGPSGGTIDKPVGTVCIGCLFEKKARGRTFCFEGDRAAVRNYAVSAAIQILHGLLMNSESQMLQWQQGEEMEF